MKSTLILSLTGLAVLCGTGHADVINLVTNGSFEQGSLGIGSFQGWQTNFGDISTFVDSSGLTGSAYGDATDGIWSAFFGSSAADGGASISQNLATVANQTYVLSFDLANDNGGTAPINQLAVSVGSAPVFVFTDLVDRDYVYEQYSFVALASSTSLEFSGSNEASYFDLDNVAVTATPEPSSWVLTTICLFFLYRSAPIITPKQ